MYDRRVVRGNTYAQQIIPIVSTRKLYYNTIQLCQTPDFQRQPIRLFLTTNTDTHTNKCLYNSLPLQIALRYSNGRPTREPWLVNVPERSWDPRPRTPSQAEATLMYKRVKTFFCDAQTPIQDTTMKKRKSPYGYVFFPRTLSGGTERSHRGHQRGLSDRRIPWQATNTALCTCKDGQRCSHADQGWRGRWIWSSRSTFVTEWPVDVSVFSSYYIVCLPIISSQV